MKKRKNILFIVLDSLRVDHLSCYGYYRDVTPFIDGLAKNSVLFRQAISPKYETVGVHASWFTGLYSSEHRIFNRKTKLGSSLKLLPAILREHGYQTAGFSNNPFVGSLHGMNYGFDTFYEAPAFDAIWKSGLKERFVNKGLRFFGFRDNDFMIKRRAERTVEKIINWFENTYFEKDESSFFIFTNFMDTHYAHYPPRKFLKKFVEHSVDGEDMKRVNKDPIRVNAGNDKMTSDDYQLLIQLYDANIAYIDSKLKSLFAYLKRKKFLNDTIVIITSDHGEQFGENGFYGHMLSLSDVLIHVPLIIYHPDVAGTEISVQVGTINLFHTILSHCGINPADYSNGRLGYDLLDKEYLKQGDLYVVAEQERWGIPEFAGVAADIDKICIRTLRYKYIEIDSEYEQLFDLKNDPDETQDIATKCGKKLQEMRTVLSQWKSSIVTNKNIIEPSYGQEQVRTDVLITKRLKALGYM